MWCFMLYASTIILALSWCMYHWMATFNTNHQTQKPGSHSEKWRVATICDPDNDSTRKKVTTLPRTGKQQYLLTFQVSSYCCLSLRSRLTVMPCCCEFPANTIHWNNVGLMLGQRRRRWFNVKTTLFQCIVFPGLTGQWVSEHVSLAIINRLWPNAVPSLDQSLRRWASNGTASGQRLAATSHCHCPVRITQSQIEITDLDRTHTMTYTYRTRTHIINPLSPPAAFIPCGE